MADKLNNPFQTTELIETVNDLIDEKQDIISDLDTIRQGAALGSTALQSITSSDVTTALGYTPYDSSNPANYVNGSYVENYVNTQGFLKNINSSDVTNALGYIPYDAENPNNYVDESYVEDYINAQGFLSYISDEDVVNALGYIPYDAENPEGYTSNVGTVTSVNNILPVDGNVTIAVDPSNNKISNTILEIPQDISVTLENNILTLKAGSTISIPVATEESDSGDIVESSIIDIETKTITEDQSITLNTSFADQYLIFVAKTDGAIQYPEKISKVKAGTILPDPTQIEVFYNTYENKFYRSNGTTWYLDDWRVAFPICAVERDTNGNFSFVKDKNGYDLIFNGACFIGDYAFMYPGIKGLLANGRDIEGGLISEEITTYYSQLIKMNTNTEENVCIDGSGYIYLSDNTGYYDKNANIYYRSKLDDNAYLPVINYITDIDSNVTAFNIRQPVELATSEMLSNVSIDSIPTTEVTLATVATTGDYTDLSNKPIIPADNTIVHITGTETITGEKTISGTSFKVTNEEQFKLLTYDTRIDRGVAPSAWTGMFPYLLIGKNNKRLSGLYCSYAQDMKNQISLIAYKGTSTDASDYSIAQIDVGYDGSTRAYAKAPTPFENTTSSNQIDTVGARNTAISNMQTTTNLVTSLSASSTDTQYPSAKCVYDMIGDIETLLSEI